VPVHHDTARKFFKDSDPKKMSKWFNDDVQHWIRHNRGFDKDGIFVLDQSHYVVPDNKNYKNAVRMPLDENGQRIDTSGLSQEAKSTIKYRLSYTVSELLHVGKEKDNFIVAGYELGPGNIDELPQGRRLVRNFVNTMGKGVMRLLITDRGLIDGEFITDVYSDLGSDVLMPIRKNMDALTDSIAIAKSFNYKWTEYEEYVQHGVTYKKEVTVVDEITLWEKCKAPLYTSIMRITGSDGSVYHWGLMSTFKPKEPKEAFELYKLRTQIEERHKQFKRSWQIAKFTSPDESLVEANVMFTFLAYNLIQMYLKITEQTEHANKAILTIKDNRLLGDKAVVVYSGSYFAAFDQYEFFKIIYELSTEALGRLRIAMDKCSKLSALKAAA
jgi:hypothetical protein